MSAQKIKTTWFALVLCIAWLTALACVPASAFAANYSEYGDKVVHAVEMGGSEDNIRLAHAACTVSYSRRVWHGGGYDGTNLWMDVFHDTLPGNKWVRACEVNVAAIVRWTGIDPTYPVYAGKLLQYARNSDKWDYLGYWNEDESKLLPGDILAYYGGTVNGKKITGLHVCMYVGGDIVKDVYNDYVKGTDGDVGKPVSGAKYVSAHSGGGNLNNKQNGIGGSGAPCMDTARTAYAKGIYHKGLYHIIRLKGAVNSEAALKAIAARKTIDDGIYRLSLAGKGSKKLDIKDASSKNGAPIQIDSSKQRASQRWRFVFTPDGYYRIINASSGKSLSIAGGKAKNKVRVYQTKWRNAKSQKWRVVKTDKGYAISSALSKKYSLYTKGGKTKKGTSIFLYKRSANKASNWRLSLVKSGFEENTFTLTNVRSKRALYTPAESGKPAKQAMENTAGSSQQWRVAYDEKTGYYTLQNVRSGKYLTAKGAKVNQSGYKSNKITQRWDIKKDGSHWMVRSAATGKALCIAKNSKKAYAKAALAKVKGNKSRLWSLRVVEEAITPAPSTPPSTASDDSPNDNLTVVTQ